MDHVLHDLLHELADVTGVIEEANKKREEIITKLYIRIEKLGDNKEVNDGPTGNLGNSSRVDT